MERDKDERGRGENSLWDAKGRKISGGLETFTSSPDISFHTGRALIGREHLLTCSLSVTPDTPTL